MIILISILLAEYFIITDAATAVDRIFAYLLFFIPLGTLTVFAQLFYRNRRIKKTGNLRSSLRYRLTIAFLLIAIIPSIPIFLISSDNLEIVVRGLFNRDVSNAMKSADNVLKRYQLEIIKQQIITMKKSGLKIPVINPAIEVQSLINDKLLVPSRDYFSIIEINKEKVKILFENRKFRYKSWEKEFRYVDNNYLQVNIVKSHKRDYLLYKIATSKPNLFLFLAKPVHFGVDKDYRRFQNMYYSLQNDEFLKQDVPGALRLGLALIYIFMICMAFLFALVIARQISNPIVSLAEATRAIADGELDTRLEIKASGEIGVLIDSFNQMTTELGVLRSRLFQTQRIAAWREVARRLAHEIKNPLTPIQLSADRMIRRLKNPQKGNLENIVLQGSNTIKEQVEVLRTLVEEFANFARLPKAVLKKTNLNLLILEVVRVFQSSPIQVQTSLAQNLPDIPLDKTLIVGLLNNLIKNSMEAIETDQTIPDSGHLIVVSTSFYQEQQRKYVCMIVEDTGTGIDAELKEKVFEPYFSTKENQHGRGLGLSLVQRTVLEHDATISCGTSSKLGGAIFTIFFRYRGN